MRRSMARWRRLLGAYRCGEPVRARRQLRAWYRYGLGQQLAETERNMLASVLPNLFGYHLLQVGAPVEADLLESSRIAHCMVLDDVPNSAQPDPVAPMRCLFGQAAALPISSASLDVLVLPHTLEFEENPHQVLREAERTLIPEGHVVILGFNPWSLWGLWRELVGWRGASPWCGRFFTTARLKDWLALLGFDTVLIHRYFFRPPVHHPGAMNRLRFMDRLGQRWWPILGGGYLLVARKRVTTLTPIRPRWRARRVVPGRMTQPSLNRQESE